MKTTTWQTAARFPSLLTHDVHVWNMKLDVYTEEQLANFFKFLDKPEQKRADHFRFPHHRTRFIAAHGVVKLILANYLETAPEKLSFHYNAHGKPALRNDSTLQFNLSHSHDMALFAVAHEQMVGIDIEYSHGRRDVDAIAHRFFAGSEYRALKQMERDEKQQSFLIGWTCKEAILKALGTGLSVSPAKIELDLVTHHPEKLLALHDLQENVQDWYLTTLAPATDYIAALAVKGKVKTLKTWCWPQLANTVDYYRDEQ